MKMFFLIYFEGKSNLIDVMDNNYLFQFNVDKYEYKFRLRTRDNCQSLNEDDKDKSVRTCSYQ